MISSEHTKRITSCIQFIDEHLDTDLSLETIAAVGSYSPFHFHRIFKYLTKETLKGYIVRKKMEKAAYFLITNKETITDIAYSLSFSSNSSFTKTFKKYYGLSPRQFRKISPKEFHSILPEESKNGQKKVRITDYICSINELKNWADMNLEISIKELPEMHLACVMSLGIQNVEKAYETLIQWGIKNQVFPRENIKMITVYHDSFKTTAPDKVRIHAGMLLEKPCQKEGPVFPEILTSGTYIVGHTEIGLEDFEKAWTTLFLWMNENGYTFRRTFPFEIYHTNFKEHPEGKTIVDFCIPIL